MAHSSRDGRARALRTVLVPAALAIAVIGAYLAWLGFRPPPIVIGEIQAVKDSRDPAQIWGYALTFIALVAVAAWFATRASHVANSAAAALFLIYVADVGSGPTPEGVEFSVMVYSVPILAGVHLVAHLAFHLSRRAHGDGAPPITSAGTWDRPPFVQFTRRDGQ